nr:mini-chromosome maintenance, DNA-dependent ATPase [Tanacetum cinerariifolium]
KEDHEEDPEEEPEEEPNKDVDIELEDDAELIFPYKEVDVAPEATAGTITQKPYAIRDFSRGLFEVGESSSARDSSNVDGLAPWALRRDLEAWRLSVRALGNFLERMSVLESGENATLKKRLAETETKLDRACNEVPPTVSLNHDHAPEVLLQFPKYGHAVDWDKVVSDHILDQVPTILLNVACALLIVTAWLDITS